MTDTVNIDELLDFNPEDKSVFDGPKTSENNSKSELFYRPNVKNSVAADKHYRALIRLIYNPKDFNRSVVERTTYTLEDAEGKFYVDSRISEGDKTCPIFTAWKKLHHSSNPELVKHSAAGPDNWFNRQTRRHVLIQVIQDENNPELNGKFLIWKASKNILTMLDTKFYKAADPKKKVFLFDYLIGPALALDIAPAAPGEPEYKVDYAPSEFETDIQPIKTVDGNDLFDGKEMEIIEQYADAKQKVIKARSDADVKKGNAVIAEIKESLRAIFQKAVQYVTDNAPDLIQEGGYHPWSEATTERVNRFIAKAVQGINPTTPDTVVTGSTAAQPVQPTQAVQPTQPEIPVAQGDAADNKYDLPF